MCTAVFYGGKCVQFCKVCLQQRQAFEILHFCHLQNYICINISVVHETPTGVETTEEPEQGSGLLTPTRYITFPHE
jgi:hypothetical protein